MNSRPNHGKVRHIVQGNAPRYRVDDTEFGDELDEEQGDHMLDDQHGNSVLKGWEGRSETHAMYRNSYD
ncbi:hypothetical protein OIN60_03025 [Paenibacillus sp. P96]|uniref:DUF4025 domain-containing protein n=1 Tax=Paenibacillus zeirhizosphaerae TaxID=2987519 RepID=A0ABT9FLZ6_9BACL|nr:hypothetical protein [Paenibacillus sp. P96]MDP4095763.1 hypothetical protein [Paenibacillus sp. P96]